MIGDNNPKSFKLYNLVELLIGTNNCSDMFLTIRFHHSQLYSIESSEAVSWSVSDQESYSFFFFFLSKSNNLINSLGYII